MGKHYVSQKYLSAFADPKAEKFIWQYDKKLASSSDYPLPIKRVAQEREYYDEETEEKITYQIERPANAVLDKLRSEEFKLSDTERFDLSMYIATMFKRVPRSRERGHAIAPQSLANVASELRDRIRDAEKFGFIGPDVAQEHLDETDRVEQQFASETPKEVVEQIESPWPSETMVRIVNEMHWRFVRARADSCFLTSDNPAFFFECYGIGNAESEITFPISSEVALFASWSPIKRPSELVVEDPSIVKEANRRVVYGASRFIFSRSRYPWIAKLARNKVERLNRIRWN